MARRAQSEPQRGAQSLRGHDTETSSAGGDDAGVSDIQMLMSAGGNLAMVQLSGDGDTGAVHAAAKHGIEGGGGQLPYSDAIQRSFGSHDISGVRAHTGDKAQQANEAMGANAYATGNDIAFKGAPDLHTAAHEAAHIVQQRGGVSLSGGVGKSGDSYEQHADAVADKVVKGESAESLLSAKSGGDRGAGVQQQAVQRDDAGAGPPARPPKPTTDEEYKALAGWGEFSANVTRFGIGDMALPAWKKAMDQLYVNQAEFERLSGDPAAMTRWVDSEPARMGFSEMAQLLLARKPLDTSAKYALWSGKPSEEYANSVGCQVLESTVLGELFNNVRVVFTEWGVMKTLWRAISNVYAVEIGKIMQGNKIKVFHRKQGEIFQQVESVALTRLGEESGIPPQYEFHPLVVRGCFGHESSYEPSPTNVEWRTKLTEAAGGDVAKAKAPAEAEGVHVFDYAGVAPVGALIDKGPKTSESASNATNDSHNAVVLAGCERAKAALESAAATSAAGADPSADPSRHPGRI